MLDDVEETQGKNVVRKGRTYLGVMAGRCATHRRTGGRVHSYCLARIDAVFLWFDSRGRCGRMNLRLASRIDHVQTNSHSQIRR